MLRKKKSFLVAMSTLLLLGALSACSGGGKEENSGATTQPSATSGATEAPPADEGYTLPIVTDGSFTLKLAVPDNPYAPKSYTQNLPVWAEFEKLTGVKIEWDVTPSAQYNQTMNVRLAAATDLPDILKLPANPVTHAEDGVIIPLNDLIEQHAPNIKKYFEKYPNIKSLLTAPDGNIYALSSDVSGTTQADPNGWLIRKDWLDKLNLQAPKTLDDWYNVLKAFKEGDPNGNGKPDEIPHAPLYWWGGLQNFGKAMGLSLGDYSESYSVDSDGKVHYDWLDPRTEDLIVWVNKLFTEGLLHPEFVTKRSPAQLLPDITMDLVGSISGFVNNTAKYEAANEVAQNDDWVMIEPPANEGVTGWYEKSGPINGYFGISKDAKNPEVAIKWLDFIFASEQGARMQSYGVEGLSYTMVDGKPEFTDLIKNNPEGLDPVSALRSIGAFPSTPWIRDAEGIYSNQAKDLAELNPELKEQASKIEPFLKESIPFNYMLMTSEESEENNRISADLNTFHEELILKFITGKEPIDWEKYVKGMKDLGVDKLVAIKQKQYDRYMGK